MASQEEQKKDPLRDQPESFSADFIELLASVDDHWLDKLARVSLVDLKADSVDRIKSIYTALRPILLEAITPELMSDHYAIAAHVSQDFAHGYEIGRDYIPNHKSGEDFVPSADGFWQLCLAAEENRCSVEGFWKAILLFVSLAELNHTTQDERLSRAFAALRQVLVKSQPLYFALKNYSEFYSQYIAAKDLDTRYGLNIREQLIDNLEKASTFQQKIEGYLEISLALQGVDAYQPDAAQPLAQIREYVVSKLKRYMEDISDQGDTSKFMELYDLAYRSDLNSAEQESLRYLFEQCTLDQVHRLHYLRFLEEVIESYHFRIQYPGLNSLPGFLSQLKKSREYLQTQSELPENRHGIVIDSNYYHKLAPQIPVYIQLLDEVPLGSEDPEYLSLYKQVVQKYLTLFRKASRQRLAGGLIFYYYDYEAHGDPHDSYDEDEDEDDVDPIGEDEEEDENESQSETKKDGSQQVLLEGIDLGKFEQLREACASSHRLAALMKRMGIYYKSLWEEDYNLDLAAVDPEADKYITEVWEKRVDGDKMLLLYNQYVQAMYELGVSDDDIGVFLDDPDKLLLFLRGVEADHKFVKANEQRITAILNFLTAWWNTKL